MSRYTKSTITLTAGEQSENHVGMQKNGSGLAEHGFTGEELKRIKKIFTDMEYKCILKDLSIDEIDDDYDAYLLIIKNGVNIILDDDNAADMMYDEQINLKWDKKFFDTRRQKVLNKHARYNLCYSREYQEPDYENGKGTIIAFDDVPLTKKLLKRFPKYFGDKAQNLELEGNLYYDIKKCYINFHGDFERRIVIATRLGATIPLHFQWYKNSETVGSSMTFNIDHGDIYIFSEKATGNDWKKRSIFTLRHAAGNNKCIKLE